MLEPSRTGIGLAAGLDVAVASPASARQPINVDRIFAQGGEIHLISSKLHLAEKDPFLLFERLQSVEEREISPSHAFYLGYEMAKAVTALTLGKQYEQDESLDWGYLTVAETSHRLDTRRPKK